MKRIFLGLFFIIIISFQGCNLNPSKYINMQENSSKTYHFESIKKLLDKKEPFTIEVFDCNVYKNYPVNKEFFNIIPNFFDNLKAEDFIGQIDTKTNKKKFEIIIKFSNETYYLNIFDDNIISLYPYDGYIKSDFIKPLNMPINYNLYKFCDYISSFKNPL